MLIRRFPKTPTGALKTVCPGENALETAASSPPVPELPSNTTSALVPKIGRMPLSMRPSSSANSGPR